MRRSTKKHPSTPHVTLQTLAVAIVHQSSAVMCHDAVAEAVAEAAAAAVAESEGADAKEADAIVAIVSVPSKTKLSVLDLRLAARG
jgi:hypothetical protein